MSDVEMKFSDRIARLEQKHGALANGYTLRVQPDGLIVAQPQKSRSGVSAIAVMLFVAAFVLFKGIMIAHVGTVTYEERVSDLRSGNVAEQAGAVVLQPGPVSDWLAQKARPYLL
jgi:hypothetical protein